MPLAASELAGPAGRRWLGEAEPAAALAKIIELATTEATSALAALGRLRRRRGAPMRARSAGLNGRDGIRANLNLTKSISQVDSIEILAQSKFSAERGPLIASRRGQHNRGQRRRGRLVSPSDLVPDEREKVTAVINGVVVRVIATDQQGRDTDVDIVQEGLRDSFGRTHERRRVAGRPRGRRQRGPQGPVMAICFSRGSEQPLRPRVLRRTSPRETGSGEDAVAGGHPGLGLVEDPLGPFPSQVVGRAEDRDGTTR